MESINFFDPKPQTLIDYDGKVILQENFIENISVDEIIAEVMWRQNEIKMFGKTHLEPRLMCFQAEENVHYSYSGIKLFSTAITPLVLEIKNKIESAYSYKFNCVLLNYYRNGNDHMSYHSDDEKELGLNPTIASVSLGDTRKFVLKHQRDQSQPKVEINLNVKSLLIMSGELQHHWVHKITKKTSSQNPRVNLTFRYIKPRV